MTSDKDIFIPELSLQNALLNY